MSADPRALAAFVGSFLDELARNGVQHLCFAPGSRSTPLVMQAARLGQLRLWDHLDERSAAFFALGMAKALHEPVALVCTSGTAAANFLPAIVEASASHIPLLVLTADRPPEVRDWGAAQTIDQIRLYGPFVKWFVDVPLPEHHPEILRYARALAARAVMTARACPPGPVHLNFPFREPLIPATDGIALHDGRQQTDDTNRPSVCGWPAVLMADPLAVAQVVERIRAHRRGLIIAGPQPDPQLGPAIVKLASVAGYPILADPLSQVRAGPHVDTLVLDAYDALLRDETLRYLLRPDFVLRVGAIPTSKALWQFLEGQPAADHVLVDPAGWPDPSHLAHELIQAPPTPFCQAVADALANNQPPLDITWVKQWQEADRAARTALNAALAAMPEIAEPRLFFELAQLLPEGATLFVGNSMPVRDLDSFFPATTRSLRIVANRGVNGIDGVVSTALGVAAVSSEPVVLVIGDLSFYHDMNGLLAARRHALRATIMLLNNDGGGIFSFLPQAAYPDHFELLFGTPHGLDFRHAAALYGLHYVTPNSWPAFQSALRDSLASPGVTVIELRTERARNVALHRALWSQAIAAGRDALAAVATRSAG
ncbi:2-succinyl-5-enolpyruvyl-6-hydroxy-3-cyclohexene-1-carboxylic-acid synthase [Thermorudis peleae]|uniref:2-succinyl-5-enolpyruvyl-6-hydroxy-3- cyclohexene-1-carboxylic-acid synthase n=1 Tax=Thermorudis peleae TaxID=1382356 RepID=UPI00056F6D7F|nr:2-succinyl-5-enolpyruvyl-6-hydroxy-3-cyclohexene-1-carboxylic-acid synthase [Thermorudis peleae]